MSHHPPSAAHYVFSKHGWSLWQEITISSKFRGKYLSIMPLGEWEPMLRRQNEGTWAMAGGSGRDVGLDVLLRPGKLVRTHGGDRTLPDSGLHSPTPPGAIHLEFKASGNHYVWRKSTSTVHNIIVGKLWIDQVTGYLWGQGFKSQILRISS